MGPFRIGEVAPPFRAAEAENQKAKGKGQKAKMEEKRKLNERLSEYGARIIKLVEALAKTLVGGRIGHQSDQNWKGRPNSLVEVLPVV